MSISKVVYYSCTSAFLVSYFFGSSWTHGPEDGFAWSRLIFLLATLLLLDKYALVPEPLTCPPFYPVYKVLVALLIANAALITLWWQIEDFIKWCLPILADLLQYLPIINKLGICGCSTTITTVQLFISGYFLCWVVLSKGFLERLKNGSHSPGGGPRRCAPLRRSRRRSKSRC